MKIPESKIEEIRSSADIVDIISGYVQLKKRGKNFVGLCPFHQEKTPSFTVSEEKQIYHCFGCHAGGNVFKFIMDYKSISFVEAVQEIAEQVGVPLKLEDKFNPDDQNENELLYDINLKAAKYFSDNLLKSERGNTAAEYFRNRNIKSQTQKNFGLGYALNGWDNFVKYAENTKLDLVKTKSIGLVDTKDDGTFYDKFRNRIIFPIFSTNGRVIAFGGRTLDSRTDIAKYLNSPESKIYLKRKSLYGLYHSKDEIRKLDRAIMVEGYMDLISLYQNGIKNVVASSGTSLTEDQVQLLSRFTRNVIVIFDADSAGQKASLRSIEILLKQDFDVKIISLPEGEDPDSYINKNSREQFDELVINSKNFLEYQTAQYEKNGMLEDPVKQSEAIRELVQSASFVSDELKRSLLIKSISRKFNLREKLLESELNKLLFQSQKKRDRLKKNIRLSKNKLNADGSADNVIGHVNNPLELELVDLLFKSNKEILGNIFDNVLPDDIENSKLRYLAKIVYDSYRQKVYSIASIIEKIDDENLQNYVLSRSLNEFSISHKRWEDITNESKIKDDLVKYSNDLIKKIKLQKIQKQIKDANHKITETENELEKIELLKNIKELQEEKKTILRNDENIIIN